MLLPEWREIPYRRWKPATLGDESRWIRYSCPVGGIPVADSIVWMGKDSACDVCLFHASAVICPEEPNRPSGFFMEPSILKFQDASNYDPVDDVIRAIGRGELVIVVDDHDRENEGDLICAAEKITPQAVNFMARYGRGLICVAVPPSHSHRLRLSPMKRERETSDRFGTAWLESVDARNDITTGISAADRAQTIAVLADPESEPRDLTRPGHVFPLGACEHGVLERRGHTEAAVDLARMAGLQDIGVICEIMRDDGEMARPADLIRFKQEHKLLMTSVAELVLYRHQHELLVEMIREVNMPTEWGDFRCRMYYSPSEDQHHIAMILGEPQDHSTPLVRIHSECLTGDLLGSLRCDCGSQLRNSMQAIADRGEGVLLYMRQEGRGIGLPMKIHAYGLQDEGLDTVEANEELGFAADLRDYGIAAQILRDLGLDKIQLLTNNPDKIEGLQWYGVEIDERIDLPPAFTPHNAKYLETKKKKMGHIL